MVDDYGYPMTALIDTGSSISLVTEESLSRITDQLREKYKKKEPRGGFFKRAKINKVTVNNPFDTKMSHSTCMVNVQFEANAEDGHPVRWNHHFYAVKGMSKPMILGAEFVRHYRSTIGYEENGRPVLVLDVPYLTKSSPSNAQDVAPQASGESAELEPQEEKITESAGLDRIGPNDPISVHEDTTGRTRLPKETQAADDPQLADLLSKYEDLLDGSLGLIKNYQHQIEMRDEKPPRPYRYPVPLKYLDTVRRLIRDMESQGVVTKQRTEYLNPLVIVEKTNGSVRICVDGRAINEAMKDDHAQPLTIDEIIARIGDRRFYTKLDITNAYWQVEIQPESRKYTGFSFDGQTYVFIRMPFGLKTAGASFTRALDGILDGVPHLRKHVITYLDDILIASDSKKQHVKHLDQLFHALREAGIRLNRDKCEFLSPKITFLGHELSRVKIEMAQSTKDAINAFPRPHSVKQVQAFLGLVNWDRKFVPNLTELTRPLETLTRKGTKFRWLETHQRAMDETKEAIQRAECLFLIQRKLPYGLQTDASRIGVGARLYQFTTGNSPREFTLAYASRALKPAELNYTTTEQEGLALAWALEKFRVILYGRTVHVRTDHKALIFLSACAVNNRRIARWIERFQAFDLRIRHIPGATNGIADTLSRNPVPWNAPTGSDRTDDQDDRDDSLAAIEIDPRDQVDVHEWIPWIRENQEVSERIQDDLLRDPDKYYVRDGLIRTPTKDGKSDRIMVPEEIGWELLEKIHRHLVHFGTDKVIAFAAEFFRVNNLDRVARDVVASCRPCMAAKHYTRPTAGDLYYDQPTDTGQVVSVDLFGPLPRSHEENKYILVLTDQFSKHTALYPVKNQKVETIIDMIERDYIPRKGYTPESFVTDCGGQFKTGKWTQFIRRVGAHYRRTTPYNPQANPVERVMKELGRILRTYAQENHEDWDVVVPRIESVINRTTHASTGYAPLALEFDSRWYERGIEPDNPNSIFPDYVLPKEILPKDRLENKPRHLEQHEPDRQQREARKQKCAVNLKRAQERRIRQANKRNRAKAYCVDEWVWRRVHKPSDAKHKKAKKLYPIFEGPYKIIAIPHKNAYVLQDEQGNDEGTWNSRQLRPHREPRLRSGVKAKESPRKRRYIPPANKNTGAFEGASTRVPRSTGLDEPPASRTKREPPRKEEWWIDRTTSSEETSEADKRAKKRRQNRKRTRKLPPKEDHQERHILDRTGRITQPSDREEVAGLTGSDNSNKSHGQGTSTESSRELTDSPVNSTGTSIERTNDERSNFAIYCKGELDRYEELDRRRNSNGELPSDRTLSAHSSLEDHTESEPNHELADPEPAILRTTEHTAYNANKRRERDTRVPSDTNARFSMKQPSYRNFFPTNRYGVTEFPRFETPQEEITFLTRKFTEFAELATNTTREIEANLNEALDQKRRIAEMLKDQQQQLRDQSDRVRELTECLVRSATRQTDNVKSTSEMDRSTTGVDGSTQSPTIINQEILPRGFVRFFPSHDPTSLVRIHTPEARRDHTTPETSEVAKLSDATPPDETDSSDAEEITPRELQNKHAVTSHLSLEDLEEYNRSLRQKEKEMKERVKRTRILREIIKNEKKIACHEAELSSSWEETSAVPTTQRATVDKTLMIPSTTTATTTLQLSSPTISVSYTEPRKKVQPGQTKKKPTEKANATPWTSDESSITLDWTDSSSEDKQKKRSIKAGQKTKRGDRQDLFLTENDPLTRKRDPKTGRFLPFGKEKSRRTIKREENKKKRIITTETTDGYKRQQIEPKIPGKRKKPHTFQPEATSTPAGVSDSSAEKTPMMSTTARPLAPSSELDWISPQPEQTTSTWPHPTHPHKKAKTATEKESGAKYVSNVERAGRERPTKPPRLNPKRDKAQTGQHGTSTPGRHHSSGGGEVRPEDHQRSRSQSPWLTAGELGEGAGQKESAGEKKKEATGRDGIKAALDRLRGKVSQETMEELEKALDDH